MLTTRTPRQCAKNVSSELNQKIEATVSFLSIYLHHINLFSIFSLRSKSTVVGGDEERFGAWSAMLCPVED
jgi:hypothetical protein